MKYSNEYLINAIKRKIDLTGISLDNIDLYYKDLILTVDVYIKECKYVKITPEKRFGKKLKIK